MKKMNVVIAVTLCGAMILTGCSTVGNMSNTAKGGVLGGAGGAGVGAGVGALLGKGKGAAIGGAIGAVVGTGAGLLIGNKMDKQKKALEQIQGAKVDTVRDVNNLPALKVTFDEGGIKFASNSYVLDASAQAKLTQLAQTLNTNPETNLQIYGYTDNTGGDKINIPLSKNRAGSVANFLMQKGVNGQRLTFEGFGSSNPVADNNTTAGRAENRRVEINISANQTMVQQANAGTLK